MHTEQERVEQLYKKLQESSSEADWKNADKMKSLAQAHQESDVALSYRLIQRAHNLDPDDEEIEVKVKEYREKLSIKKSLGNTKLSSDKREGITSKRIKTGTLKLVDRSMSYKESALKWLKQNSFKAAIVIPVLIFYIYSAFIATERYEAGVKLVVEESGSASTALPELAMLSGFGASSVNNDARIVEAYILSNDMLDYLQTELDLFAHYTMSSADVFSRLSKAATKEDFLDYFQSHVSVTIDQESGIIEILAQGFTPEFAKQLATTIVTRAEWLINEVGHQLAEGQLEFVKKEHDIAMQKLRDAQTQLLTFQQLHGLLDPETEGVAMQNITYSLESKIAETNAQLNALLQVMSESSSEVIQAQNQLNGLTLQLERERERLAQKEGQSSSISEVLVKYSELKVNVELALQAYATSLASLEKSRVDAYQQLKFLVTIESATEPESTSYPEVGYNVALFAVLLLMVYGIARIVIATILELK